jgi:hypothetical protein
MPSDDNTSHAMHVQNVDAHLSLHRSIDSHCMNPKCGEDVCNYDKLSPLLASLTDGLAQQSNTSKRDWLLIFPIIKYFCHGGYLENVTK